MRRFIVAVGALAVLSSPAIAQDGSEPVQTRSPEQAQAFFAEQHARYGSAALWRVPEIQNHNRGSRYWSVDYHGGAVRRKLVSITSPSRCVTRLTFANDSQELLNAPAGYPTALSPMAPVDIDWSRVTIMEFSGWVPDYMSGNRFKDEGIQINFAVPGGIGDRLHLVFDTGHSPNWTVSTRMKVAAQFLIEQCYQRSETGF